MLGTYAVPDLIGVEHIGQRVEVVESLAEDDNNGARESSVTFFFSFASTDGE